jgi:RNA polymerase sigma-70 factor, ECF subfamily
MTSDAEYESAVRHLGGRLHAVARRLVRDDEEAADVVQDAFLSAYRSLPSYRGDAQLSTWLHRIVVNAARMRLRTRGRRFEGVERGGQGSVRSATTGRGPR